MKTLALLLCAALAVGLALAGGEAKEASKGKTHEETVEVVSFDLDAKTITMRDEKGENHTAPVLGKAIGSLKTLKAGQKIVVTCLDDESGTHQGVSEIKHASPEKPAGY